MSQNVKNTFLSLNPKYEKIYFCFIFGGPGGGGGLTSNPGERKVIPHHRAEIFITREQNVIYGHNITKYAFLAIRGVLGGP